MVVATARSIFAATGQRGRRWIMRRPRMKWLDNDGGCGVAAMVVAAAVDAAAVDAAALDVARWVVATTVLAARRFLRRR